MLTLLTISASGLVSVALFLAFETHSLLPTGSKVHVPYSGRVLPATLPCGARTFLYAQWCGAQRLSGQLRTSFYSAQAGWFPGAAPDR